MLGLHDVVKLRKPDLDAGVTTENIGAVIDILGGGAAYTVEFLDDHNETIKASIFKEYTEDELIRIWEAP